MQNKKLYSDILGEDWEENCPEFLSAIEKTHIKAVLLRHFENRNISLQVYLRQLRVINDYPEKA